MKLLPLVISALIVVLSPSLTFANAKIAIMAFDDQSGSGKDGLGQRAADVLTTSLVKVGVPGLSVIGHQSASTAAEKRGIADDASRLLPSNAVKIGKDIGVDYVLTGIIHEFGNNTSNVKKSENTSGGSNWLKNLSGTFKTKKYRSSMDIRIIRVENGEILFADNASSDNSSSAFDLKALGGINTTNNNDTADDSHKELKLLRVTMAQLALNIAEKNLDFSAAEKEPQPPTMVADVDGKTITLNKGTDGGFQLGQLVTVSRVRKMIKDPETGEILKVKYKTIGTIKLTEVENGYAEGEIVEGKDFKVKDMILD